MFEPILKFFSNNQELLWYLAVTSGAMLVISALVIPWMVVRLPVDFYTNQDHAEPWLAGSPVLRTLFLLVKNLLGLALLAAGVLMLVLPGQGILTLLAGLALVDFPGKRRLELAILSSPSVSGSANWIRERAGRPPLQF